MKNTNKVLITIIEIIVSVTIAYFIAIAITPSPYQTKEEILSCVGDTVLVDDGGGVVVLTEEMILSEYDITEDGKYIHHSVNNPVHDIKTAIVRITGN